MIQDDVAGHLDRSALALHFEVSLSGAEPRLLAELAQADRYRRSAAVSSLAHHLARRMDCFDIAYVAGPADPLPLPLFPDLDRGAA